MIKTTEQKKHILAIETSCDDTCIALVKDDVISANIVISSSKQQSEYGGVVPELAARYHEKNIIPALKKIIEEGKIIFEDIDYIAYTNEPGLRVCLNVGEAMAQTLGLIFNKPLIKVNHLHSHIFSFWDLNSEINYPIIGLVASGGHTSIFYVENCYDIKLLNETTDDAVGECYDKIARELNLGYPGGPVIDDLYDASKANINFLNKTINSQDQFSFSGLKTAVLNYINNQKMKNLQLDVVSIVSSFQKLVIDILIDKLKYYASIYPRASICIGGGVSANKLLRQRVMDEFTDRKVYIPPKELANDNAVMIAIMANLLT